MRKFLPLAPLLLAVPFASPAQTQRPPATDVAPTVAAFLEQFDATGSGSVSWEQFVAFRQQRYAQTDENGDGVVDEDEYVNEYLGRLDARLEKARAGHVAQTRTRFDALDADKDGRLTRAEFDAVGERTWSGYQKLLAQGPAERTRPVRSSDPLRMPTSHSLAGMLEIYDRNGDGRVDRAEFDQVRATMFADADRGGDGQVRFEDYLGEFEDRLDRRAAQVRDAAAQQARVRFKALDADKDGRMTFAEYQVSGKRLFDRADSNGDGVVDARDPEPAPAATGHGSATP
ncbi:EF-hand domain-containing protein [Stenotrophomonas mori]|uniref:EF-hand domain-containing protein n=1 Tax=Stenotrophomonas mori TaxID=2871096 RepID=A0ABT0SHS7_9GAMM|nr:EF-hand domain-containing protein [Stenotrophomonas mori]MCL7714893.1 EF-hand domain-containing protein [Stenotrophomonas mori]